MIRHVARLGAASLLVVGSMLLPFLPGRYDGLAVTLSWMAQLLGIAGLILIPLGAIWLALEVRSGTKDDGTASARWQTGVAVASITASTAAAALLSLYAATTAGLSLGVGFIGLWAYAAARLFAGVRSAPRASVRRFNAMPLYLVVLPSVAAIGRMTLVGPAAELSRNRAIESSTELINDIERYRDIHGYYPRSLHSVWEDYDPGITGVERYHYEPNGEAYNLYFEHFSTHLGTREFVMYNRRDEHEMTSHNMDLLRLTATELASRRGYYAVHDASRRHWKRFLFD